MSESWEHTIQPHAFAALRSGGLAHRFLADTVVHRGGRTFADTNQNWRIATLIRNPNTRDAYYRACTRFLSWSDGDGFTPASIGPLTVAAYIELPSHDRAAPTVKLHLAAPRMLFEWLVIGAVAPTNPCFR
jgi:hypothetical protein